MSRIVITGTGAICGAGQSPEAVLDAVLEGRSAIREITSFDVSAWPRRNAAEVADCNAAALVGDRKLIKLIRRTDVFGIYAGGQAVGRAGWDAHREGLDEAASTAFSEDTACYVGSGGGAYNVNYDYFPLMAETHGDMPAFGRDLASQVNPMWLLRTLPNNVLCHVGIRHLLKGPNGCITHHTTGGILALGEAAQSIRDGEAQRALAVGHDTPVEPQMVLYYHRCGLVAEHTIRPFDVRHDGSVLGEGAAAVAVETEASARARGADVLGIYEGIGNLAEGEGLLALRPDGDGAIRAMRAALDDAGVGTGDIGMIVAHGNGTPQSDASEAAALRTVFGRAMPPVTAFKWVTGHPLAASGILDVSVGLAALRRGVVPGIAELAQLAPECEGVNASSKSREPAGDRMLVLCRGFGGTNVAVVIRGAS